MFVEDGDKYELEGRGLRVNRLSVWDNGTYECRAEVASHGNVKLRHVHLEVLCKNAVSSRSAVFLVKGMFALYLSVYNGGGLV